jgi:glycosyltransferase involved in cell wall biosynthesis
MIPGQSIVIISSIEWDFLWQGHQEIATRLAQAGNTVLYVENTGVRSPGLRDGRRVARRLKRLWQALPSCGTRLVAPNLYVCPPLVLPPFGSALRRRLNRYLLRLLVCRAARQIDLRGAIIFSYLPTDTAVDLVKLLHTPRSLLIYYCIADFSHLTPHVVKLRRSERELVELSDLVFAQCPELAAHCSPTDDREVHIFPFGVSLAKFGPEARRPRVPPPAGQPRGRAVAAFGYEELPRPVIGYVGGLHKHLDVDLLADMARARADWSWVLVGAVQRPVAALARLPNVHLLGQQPHADLVHHVQNFDACVVPYVTSRYTATVVPTKINEYLAMGKPVAATGLPSVCDFNRRNDGVLFTAPNEPAPFLAAIERALASAHDEEAVSRRRAAAARADWRRRLEEMSALIEAKLREKGRHPEACKAEREGAEVLRDGALAEVPVEA